MHGNIMLAASRNAAKQPMVQACESTQQLTINGCNQPKPHNSSVAYSMQYAAFFTKQQQEAFSTWCERTGEHTPRHSTADQTETESCSAQCRIASLCLASNKHHRCSLGNPQQPLAPLTPSQQIWVVTRSGALTQSPILQGSGKSADHKPHAQPRNGQFPTQQLAQLNRPTGQSPPCAEDCSEAQAHEAQAGMGSRHRKCIQSYNKPVERGSQSTDAVSKTVAAYLRPAA